MSASEDGGQHEDWSALRVAICAATCRRPAGLRRLIEGIARLQFADGAPPQITIIIVDNDPAGDARAVVESMRSASSWPIVYVHEPQPGVPQARNAAMASVDDTIDFVCFIDDDEAPRPAWLNELLRVQRECAADVVAGPVAPEYEPGVPAWVKRGGFFVRARHETGAALDRAYTNNVLFNPEIPRRLNLRFDDRFAGNMGEDQAYFRSVAQAGGRIVWADGAVVVETIPASRARARFLIRRMYEVGRSTATIESKIIAGGIPARLVCAAKGAVWIIIGCMSLPAGLLARRWAVRSLRWLMYGLGLLHGVVRPR